MSRYGYNSDYRQGERAFERDGRYGYDERRYTDHWSQDNRDYQQGFDDARRAEERRQEERAAEEAAQRRAEAEAAERRRQAQQEEEAYWEQRQAEAEQEQAAQPQEPEQQPPAESVANHRISNDEK